MIKSATFALIAIIAATSQFAAPMAFAQAKSCPTTEPNCDLKFGPKDIEPPRGPAFVPAQTAPSTMPPSAPTASPPVIATEPGLTLTDAQVKAWIDKAVYSSDDKKIGEVSAFARDGTGKVTEMHADIGGFFGLGETRIRLMPAQFTMGTDRVILKVTAEQAKAMPPITK